MSGTDRPVAQPYKIIETCPNSGGQMIRAVRRDRDLRSKEAYQRQLGEARTQRRGVDRSEGDPARVGHRDTDRIDTRGAQQATRAVFEESVMQHNSPGSVRSDDRAEH